MAGRRGRSYFCQLFESDASLKVAGNLDGRRTSLRERFVSVRPSLPPSVRPFSAQISQSASSGCLVLKEEEDDVQQATKTRKEEKEEDSGDGRMMLALYLQTQYQVSNDRRVRRRNEVCGLDIARGGRRPSEEGLKRRMAATRDR